MEKRPWFKFYPTDWRGDKELRLCGAAARGLWIEMLCVMHEGKPYGHLVVNGRPVTETQLSSLSGFPLDQVHALLAELENVGVFSRTGDGVVYSRRMTRDARKAAKCAKAGRKGGNPALTLKGEDKGESATAFVPEARGHIPDIPKEGFLGNVALSLSPNRKPKNISASEKKALWQGKICNWAQRTLPTEKYMEFLDAWTNDVKWAKELAEKFNTQMRAAESAQRATA